MKIFVVVFSILAVLSVGLAEEAANVKPGEKPESAKDLLDEAKKDQRKHMLEDFVDEAAEARASEEGPKGFLAANAPGSAPEPVDDKVHFTGKHLNSAAFSELAESAKTSEELTAILNMAREHHESAVKPPLVSSNLEVGDEDEDRPLSREEIDAMMQKSLEERRRKLKENPPPSPSYGYVKLDDEGAPERHEDGSIRVCDYEEFSSWEKSQQERLPKQRPGTNIDTYIKVENPYTDSSFFEKEQREDDEAHHWDFRDPLIDSLDEAGYAAAHKDSLKTAEQLESLMEEALPVHDMKQLGERYGKNLGSKIGLFVLNETSMDEDTKKEIGEAVGKYTGIMLGESLAQMPFVPIKMSYQMTPFGIGGTAACLTATWAKMKDAALELVGKSEPEEFEQRDVGIDYGEEHDDYMNCQTPAKLNEGLNMIEHATTNFAAAIGDKLGSVRTEDTTAEPVPDLFRTTGLDDQIAAAANDVTKILEHFDGDKGSALDKVRTHLAEMGRLTGKHVGAGIFSPFLTTVRVHTGGKHGRAHFEDEAWKTAPKVLFNQYGHPRQSVLAPLQKLAKQGMGFTEKQQKEILEERKARKKAEKEADRQFDERDEPSKPSFEERYTVDPKGEVSAEA